MKMKVKLLRARNCHFLVMWSIWILCCFTLKMSNAFVLEGSQTSYAQFRKWYPAPNSSIELEFLTDNSNGVLLYTDDGGYYDFFELKLVEATVRLRYNLGGGARVLTVGKGLCDGLTWHRVQVWKQIENLIFLNLIYSEICKVILYLVSIFLNNKDFKSRSNELLF